MKNSGKNNGWIYGEVNLVKDCGTWGVYYGEKKRGHAFNWFEPVHRVVIKIIMALFPILLLSFPHLFFFYYSKLKLIKIFINFILK